MSRTLLATLTAVREKFLPGGAASRRIEEPQAQPPDEPQIAAWIAGRVAGLVQLPAEQIDLDTPLTRYGIDSRSAFALAGDLERWLGRPIDPTFAWDYPTVAEMARYLAPAPA